MQKAIPYKSSWVPMYGNSVFNPRNNDGSSSPPSWLQPPSSSSTTTPAKRREMVRESAVVVFARRGCCMGHVVKRLVLTHGVNPLVVEVDEDDPIVTSELGQNDDHHNKVISNSKERLPVVFIGGKLFGGLETVMAAHINGDLVPILRQAGALWL
ncbi:PREDICTED: monothiol glutaredoxin-S13 [Tarenaya hassleriana]|uniref:monothiol glutaredoxin-S13 n=1 Tax=Tarenaya hassleriana TaxID=28532 RepID=UPI00053C95E9|nr:PREDICTED: monothiol glutaredoxin-S13 [Tarenaya hassleriana]